MLFRSEAEQKGTEPGTEGNKPQAQGQPLSLAKAFEKFKEQSLDTAVEINAFIPDAVKQWVNNKIQTSDLGLTFKYEQNNGHMLSAETSIEGVYTYKDPSDESKYIYAPPQLKVSEVVAGLIKDDTGLKMLIDSTFGLDLTLRKVVAKFHRFEKRDKKDKLEEKGYYVLIAVYTDVKPEPSGASDDKTVLNTPNDSAEYSIEDSSSAPEVAAKPFCVIGIGEDQMIPDKKQKWGHIGVSLRALLQANAEFQIGRAHV